MLDLDEPIVVALKMECTGKVLEFNSAVGRMEDVNVRSLPPYPITVNELNDYIYLLIEGFDVVTYGNDANLETVADAGEKSVLAFGEHFNFAEDEEQFMPGNVSMSSNIQYGDEPVQLNLSVEIHNRNTENI